MVYIVGNNFVRTAAVTMFALVAVALSVLLAGEVNGAPDDGQSQELLSISGAESGGQERLVRSPALGANFFRLNTARGFGKRSSAPSSLAARIAAAVAEQQQRQRSYSIPSLLNSDASSASSSSDSSYYSSADADDEPSSSIDNTLNLQQQSRPLYFVGNRNSAPPLAARSLFSSRLASLPLGLSSMAYIPYESTMPLRSLRGFP